MTLNFKALLVFFCIVKCLAVILTLFRLGFRLKIQRFWWEDMWAAVALLCTLVSITVAFLVYEANHHELVLSASRINGYMFTNIIWSVRLSLIFSIIRIAPSVYCRRITLGVAACFLLFWATTLGLETWWCADNTQRLSNEARLVCMLPRPMIIFEITNIATSIFPLKLLWRVKLPRRQRRMFLSIFSASRFLCAFSFARLIVELAGLQSVQAVLSNVQLSIFLIACNLLVVVTYVYRVFQSSPDEALPSGLPMDDDDFTMPAPGSKATPSLTTVELTLPCESGSDIASEQMSVPGSIGQLTMSEPEG